MPSLGADMEDATLVEWQKQVGDPVHRGDVIAVVETQKGAIEIESFEDGVLERYLVELGETVSVGAPLAYIGVAAQAQSEHPVPGLVEPVPQSINKTTRLRITPAARRLAGEKGIDAASVIGSGPGGEIVRSDILVAAQQDCTKPDAMSAMRAAIASAMTRSKREIPHYYLQETIDLTDALAWVTEHNARRTPTQRLLPGVLYLKAVAIAAGKYPEFNGHFRDGHFEPSQSVHVGMAIRIRNGGLVAPAIHNTDQLDLDALMTAARDLTERVRAGRFRASELADPTITVSSLGERGVECLYGVIYPPQVAIVGFGKPAQRPWIVQGRLAARDLVTVTLAADHRVSDGYRGGLLLRTIKTLLENPESL